ncbi:hypothetical protein R3P38DRAFT_3212800 [Favolaschia claudopus]|uniref:Uncharacterized protein n=1 Tax=Favolaschia claudopus TaxID=2862362 RepID=A0AAW0AE17_9AGAR
MTTHSRRGRDSERHLRGFVGMLYNGAKSTRAKSCHPGYQNRQGSGATTHKSVQRSLPGATSIPYTLTSTTETNPLDRTGELFDKHDKPLFFVPPRPPLHSSDLSQLRRNIGTHCALNVVNGRQTLTYAEVHLAHSSPILTSTPSQRHPISYTLPFRLETKPLTVSIISTVLMIPTLDRANYLDNKRTLPSPAVHSGPPPQVLRCMMFDPSKMTESVDVRKTQPSEMQRVQQVNAQLVVDELKWV